jgi:hypothetical protein
MELPVQMELMGVMVHKEVQEAVMVEIVPSVVETLEETVVLAVKAAAALRVVQEEPNKQEIRILVLWAWQEQEETEAQVQEAVQEEMSVLIIMLD